MVTDAETILAKLNAVEHKLDDAMTKTSSEALAAEMRKLAQSVDELKSVTKTKSAHSEGFVDTLKTASKDAMTKLINSENLLSLLNAIGNNVKDMDADRIVDVSAAINNIITTLQRRDGTIMRHSEDIVRDFSDMLDAKIHVIHKQCVALLEQHRVKTMSIDKDIVATCLANNDLTQKALKDFAGEIAHPVILGEDDNKDTRLFRTVTLEGSQINADVYLNIIAIILADLQCWRDIRALSLLNNQFMCLNTQQYLNIYHSLRDRNFKKAVTHLQTEVCEDERIQILAELQECDAAKLLRLDKLAKHAQELTLQMHPIEDVKTVESCKQHMKQYMDELTKATKLAMVHKETKLLEPAERVELTGTMHSKIASWSNSINDAYDILLQRVLPLSHHALLDRVRIMAASNSRPECIRLNTSEYKKVDIITATQEILNRSMRTQNKLEEISSSSTLKGIQIAEVCLHHAQQHIAHITDNYQTFAMSVLMPIMLQNLRTLHNIEIKIISNTSTQKVDAQSTIQSTQKQVHGIFEKVANTFIKAITFATTAFTSILSKMFSMISLMLEQLLNILQVTKTAIASATNAFGNIVPQLFSVVQVLAESSARIVNSVLSIALVGVEALFGTAIHILQNHTVLSAIIIGVMYSSYKAVSHWLTAAYSEIHCCINRQNHCSTAIQDSGFRNQSPVL